MLKKVLQAEKQNNIWKCDLRKGIKDIGNNYYTTKYVRFWLIVQSYLKYKYMCK